MSLSLLLALVLSLGAPAGDANPIPEGCVPTGDYTYRYDDDLTTFRYESGDVHESDIYCPGSDKPVGIRYEQEERTYRTRTKLRVRVLKPIAPWYECPLSAVDYVTDPETLFSSRTRIWFDGQMACDDECCVLRQKGSTWKFGDEETWTYTWKDSPCPEGQEGVITRFTTRRIRMKQLWVWEDWSSSGQCTGDDVVDCDEMDKYEPSGSWIPEVMQEDVIITNNCTAIEKPEEPEDAGGEEPADFAFSVPSGPAQSLLPIGRATQHPLF